MKKLLSMLLSVLFVLFALVGCDFTETNGSTEEPPRQTDDSVPTETEAPSAAITEVPTEATVEEPSEAPSNEPTETESEESTSAEDPTQYPARGKLFNISSLPGEKLSHEISDVLEAIENAPEISPKEIPLSEHYYEVRLGDAFDVYNCDDAYQFLEQQYNDTGLYAVCKLNATHICVVSRFYRPKDGASKYAYTVYRWENGTPEKDDRGWHYTHEVYVATRQLSSHDFSEIRVGTLAGKIFEMEPAIQSIRWQNNYYFNSVAFLLQDGIMYVELDNCTLSENATITRMEFIPYGESAEINGYSLVMPTAENLPPLPEE